MVSIADVLILSRIPGIGPNRLRALVSHFGDSSRVLQSTAREIAAIEGFSRKLASTIAHFRDTQGFLRARQFARLQLSRLNAANGFALTYWDSSYPELLKRIYDPPALLYVRGSLKECDGYAIGIVGTRFPSDYGVACAEQFGKAFAGLGITVVSGLARGIDTVAHGATLAHGGRTIAIIGSGLDVIYPPENKPLAERMVKNGSLISEYDMGAPPDAVNFPKRNRLISGLTLGTLIIETDLNGGAMITANMALDQNREVFAIPGNIGGKRSRGCNALIREGKAKLVESVDDILVELRHGLPASVRPGLAKASKPLPDLTLFEKNIYDQLSPTPIDIDALAEKIGSTTSETLVHLLSLEFKGLVRQFPGKLFATQEL